VLEECVATIRGTDISPHDRYLRLFRLLKERDESIATAFDDLRRSTAIQRLAAMIALGVIPDEELGRFSATTRDSAVAMADSWRSIEKRRNVR